MVAGGYDTGLKTMPGQATDPLVVQELSKTPQGRFTACGEMGEYILFHWAEYLPDGEAMPKIWQKGTYMNQAKQPNLQYLVLATGTMKQELLASALSRRFPKERGRIFLPEREYWIRKTQSIGRKPLFPGYLFAYTDMSQKELYLFVRQNSRDIMTFVNELAVKAVKDSGVTIEDQIWSELTADETAFLDSILDADGVERMSVGYKQGDHYNIVEGPLKGLEEHIVWSNRHDREARLDVTFHEKPIMVGLELKPKKAFFPEGEELNNTMLMDDGTEVDLKDLAQRMMRGEGGVLRKDGS